jgi:hypothetical protein
MDKAVVRESKFRHAFGKPWRKEMCITNIQLGQVASSTLIKANDRYIAVPWQAASGALAIIPLGQSGEFLDHPNHSLSSKPLSAVAVAVVSLD